MDDFSRIILKELLPIEKDICPPATSKSGREDLLDHLASPILLERAAHLRKLAKFGEGWASEVLREYPQHAIHLLVRNRNGNAEVHTHFADLFFVLEGHGTLATGGSVVCARQIGPGEVRGDSLEGSSLQELRAGDVAHVPAGLPHQMLVAGEKSVTCLVLKIEQMTKSE